MYCRICNQEIEPITTRLNEGPHYSRKDCPLCDNFLGFGKKPKNEGKRGRASKYKPGDLEIDYCEFCGRYQQWLGEYEALDVHHKIEIGRGGVDEPENLLVLCTACHRLCEHQRIYLNQHLRRKYETYEIVKDYLRNNIGDEVEYNSLIATLTDLLGI